MPEVHVTADALIALRATSRLAARWGVAAPHDHLFATPAGRRLADLALCVDPVYEAFNLARFRWFSERFADAVTADRQIVLRGAGFDTRGDALGDLGDLGLLPPLVMRHPPLLRRQLRERADLPLPRDRAEGLQADDAPLVEPRIGPRFGPRVGS